jgi:hypothetical protein
MGVSCGQVRRKIENLFELIPLQRSLTKNLIKTNPRPRPQAVKGNVIGRK